MAFTAIPGTTLSRPANVVPGLTLFGEIPPATRWRIGHPFGDWSLTRGGPVEISSQATEWLRCRVSDETPDGQTQDPTGGTPQFAFLGLEEQPDSDTTWANGQWLQGDRTGYWASFLVVAGSLAVDEYLVWVRILGTPEVPVLASGTLTVY